MPSTVFELELVLTYLVIVSVVCLVQCFSTEGSSPFKGSQETSKGHRANNTEGRTNKVNK